jgi:hypothetical protein
MTIVLIIDKSGTIKEIAVKSYNEDELYKKAGFKVTEGFVCQTTWPVEIDEKKYNVSLYAKSKGRAGQENKYDFPPPVDKHLFFGSCLLVNTGEDNVANDLKESEWEKIYEHLFGGFEDIGSEDSEDVSRNDEIDLPRTKSGYVKDGFIVEDNDMVDKETTDESEDEFVETPKKNKNKIKKTTKKVAKDANSISSKKDKKKKTVFETIETPDNNVTELNCTTELVEEEYL